MRTIAALLIVLSLAGTASAQTIYETRDKAGPVYSDVPSPGAEQIQLPPPNVIEVAPAPPAAAGQPPAAAPAYQSFQFVQPEAGGTIHTNTGEFHVVLSLAPPLDAAAGNAIALTLDGTRLARLRKQVEFDITPEEFQGAAADNVEHRLGADVIDGAGRVLISAPPVAFFMHRASIRR
jgi:hypothetical protein